MQVENFFETFKSELPRYLKNFGKAGDLKIDLKNHGICKDFIV